MLWNLAICLGARDLSAPVRVRYLRSGSIEASEGELREEEYRRRVKVGGAFGDQDRPGASWVKRSRRLPVVGAEGS